ncbi:hypothetical protein PR202_gb26626 [Eleusine coracana subsp. coracana]|uniref:Uncharacterized protein n=1 Tax=Eleusine coracana subsp. coracana TaxID=191504 RepID=A0AAV5FPP7_ELECO|nr:hypothetical protein PR202_gb26626 [Eleusine coracana subsp. coracana]
MASSASLLQAATASAAVFSPLQYRRQPAPQLNLRCSVRRRRGISLTASSAASPEVQEEPSPSSPPQASDLSAIADSVKVLKEAAKTRKVPATRGAAGERAVFPSDCKSNALMLL